MARVDNQGGNGFTVDNGTGLQVRTKLQQTIDALRSLQAGDGDPTVGVSAYQLHVDEVSNTSQILKIRNKANNDFISIGDVAQTNLGLLPRSGGTSVPMTGQFVLDNSSSSSSPSLSFNGDSDTGIYRKQANVIGFTTAGVERINIGSSSLTLRDISIFFPDQFGVVGTFLQGASTISPPSGSASLNFTLPASIVDGGFLKTDASGNLSFSAISSAASDLTGNTLASGVTASSLTSVGTLTALTVSGDSKLTTIKDTSGNNPSTPAALAQGRAKVWINFNGTTATSAQDLTGVRDSFNVSSVVDTAQGVYTVNFTNAMSSANYCLVASGSQELDSVGNPDLVTAHTYATSSVKLETFFTGSSSTPNDLAIVCLAIFGDQ